MKTLLATLLLLCHYGIATHSHAQASFFDPTFGVGGKTIVPLGAMEAGMFRALAIQPDGKIVAAGTMKGKAAVARFKENGTPDSTFAVNGYYIYPGSFSNLYDVVIQPDGKIVATGSIDVGLDDDPFFALRLNADGSLDGSFGASGIKLVDYGTFTNSHSYSLALQPDGKIVIAGETTPRNAALARLKADGSIDSSFGANGLVTGPYGDAQKVAIAPDGKIVIGGTASAAQNYALMTARYSSGGIIDTTYNHTGIVYTIAGEARGNFGRALAVQPDGKIIIAGSGSFGTQGGNMVAVRYHTNGMPDDWFGTGGIASIDIDGANESCLDIYLAPTGKILLVGSTVGTEKRNVAVVRLKTNGTLDWLFGIGGKIVVPIQLNSDYGHAVTLQTDEKLVFCGNTYTAGDSYSDPYVARLTPYPTSLAEVSSVDNHPIIFPNPAKDVVSIRASVVTGKPQVTLCDMAGNNIHINYISGASSISVRNLPNGLYLMKFVYADGSTKAQSVVVQH